ncbi:hypothetical protein CXG81DRAFT_12464 [Caulochytrium protostelioides]|uniref:RNA helicase n=1 Tax=Caulochytrium protostelioides TaxID=1555241 RepID=A0A4P9X750_9FUNG|nr:DEAD-domain-containing protein [Caulochytrium protostelioides]RKP01057.1 hypothetical protein CXG81DRAFT_12464 [Caulochytrium protostelioides]|eukprot:RKP01057.1 hypothetical protein CXG81DRAFT_12464 [Caulochytrium protostelioides]
MAADPVEETANKLAAVSTEDEVEEGKAYPAKATELVNEDTDNQVELKLDVSVNAELYHAVSTFDDLGLHADLLKGIYAMGFKKPSKIQEKALPLLLSNPPKNIIAQSQSGTGKTAAFVLTMLSRVDPANPATQAICMAPARELARQIMDNVQAMGKYTSVTTGYAIRDAVAKGEKVDAQIVIGTPGTIMDLIKRRQLVTRDVKILVLDEADNMLDQQGLGDQSLRVKKLMPPTCQILLFSATFTDLVRKYAETFAPKANQLSLKREELSVEGIKQFYMDCKDAPHKVVILCSIYNLLTIGQSIIFVHKRSDADNLAEEMRNQGHVVNVLHGGLDSTARDAVIDGFRDMKFKVLITTNVISRGIDISNVSLVINFDLPVDQSGRADAETYLHRIGRTGRFGRAGVSINFVHDARSLQTMKEIEEHFGRPITRVPTDNLMVIEKTLKKIVG